MKDVAQHLENEAIRRKSNPAEVNTFARSAINRYYYTTFLLARELMRKFKSDWQGSHSSLPEELTGSVKKDISSTKRKATRIHDWETVNQCDACIHRIHSLSELLKAAYALRIIADYEPEIAATVDPDGQIFLSGTKMTEAKMWPSRAQVFSAEIERIWSSVNGL